jgi:hypothetical protein
MEVSGQLHTLAILHLWEESLVPIGYEVGWAAETVWMLWRREKSLAHARK